MEPRGEPYAPERIERWRMPRHYFGQEWNGYYAAPCSRHRESDVIERSNWIEQLRQIPETEDGESVVVVRENHFLCGWVEWLAIREDAHDALRIADALAARLETYPVLNESLMSDMEYEEEQEWNERMKAREDDE